MASVQLRGTSPRSPRRRGGYNFYTRLENQRHVANGTGSVEPVLVQRRSLRRDISRRRATRLPEARLR
jgi:hypothetical protein